MHLHPNANYIQLPRLNTMDQQRLKEVLNQKGVQHSGTESKIAWVLAWAAMRTVGKEKNRSTKEQMRVTQFKRAWILKNGGHGEI